MRAPLLLALACLPLGCKGDKNSNEGINSVSTVAATNLNLCQGLVVSTDRLAVPALEKPTYLQTYRDPTFGTKVTRITNSAFGEVRKPKYSTMQAWNADESLLMLFEQDKNGQRHILLNGQTYEPERVLNIVPSDLEEVHWSHTKPNEFFYISKAGGDRGQFKRYDTRNNSSTLVKNFTPYCGAGLPTGGSDIQMQSLDDDLFGFRCRTDSGDYSMISYRISTDETIVKPLGNNTPWDNATAPSPAASGERFWFQGTALAADLETIEQTMDMGRRNEHANIGRTHDGQDAIYQVAFNASPNECDGATNKGIGHLVEHNLETGGCRPIIAQDRGYPYPTSATHISAQAYKRQQWIALSSVGSAEQFEFFTNGKPAPALFSEIYLANTNPDNPVVCRLAHHRSTGKLATQGDYAAYFGEPHVTISPSGTRVVFGSDWYDAGSVDTYVIELPSFAHP